MGEGVEESTWRVVEETGKMQVLLKRGGPFERSEPELGRMRTTGSEREGVSGEE